MCLAACVQKREDDVWRTYDIRHPVPAGSTVPDSYARQYDAYIDNDTYYSPPNCYGAFVGASCIGGE